MLTVRLLQINASKSPSSNAGMTLLIFSVAVVITQCLLYFGLLVVPAPSPPPLSAVKNEHQHKDVTSLLIRSCMHETGRKKK